MIKPPVTCVRRHRLSRPARGGGSWRSRASPSGQHRGTPAVIHRPRAGDGTVEPVQPDETDDRSVAAAVAGAQAVVNAVSLYIERGGATFRAIHVEAAARIAREAQRAGLATPGPALRHRRGSCLALALYPQPRRRRPGGARGLSGGDPDPAWPPWSGRTTRFLVPLARMLRRAPVFPLFGGGRTRLQPAYVEDVAAAIVRAMAGQGGRHL